MSDQQNLIQESYVSKEERNDPEYQRLMDAYTQNPFHDLTKASIEDFNAKRPPSEPDPDTRASDAVLGTDEENKSAS